MIDVEYGNMTAQQAETMAHAIGVTDPYPAGATEAWIANLLRALIIANNAKTVLETGCFMGHTSKVLLRTLEDLGRGHLLCCEIDPVRASVVDGILDQQQARHARFTVRNEDVLQVIRSLDNGSLDFAFVDDDHGAAHVAEEIEALLPKMSPGGLITFHDVYGVCDLQKVVKHYGGYSLSLPRCGPAGGLGLLQCL